MIKSIRFIIILSLVVLIVSSSCDRSGDFKLVVENTANFSRTDEPVSISRDRLELWFGAIETNKVPVLYTKDGELVPSQADDLTGDGNWDELFLLSNLAPSSKLELIVKFVNKEEAPEYPARSNIRFAKITEDNEYVEVETAVRLEGTDTEVTSKAFQMEGPAWENELVGYRNYFDERNGMDIFGKTTTEMVLDHVGIDENYHVLQSWGMDILKVGTSLGAGSMALLEGDSLYRLAVPSNGSYRLITDGPLRSIFQLIFEDWQVGDETYNVVHEISIWGGSYAYESKVTLSGDFEGKKTLVAGIVNMDLADNENILYVEEHDPGFISLSTHGKQAFDGEYLGMAIITGKNSYLGHGKSPDEGDGIIQTYYAKLGCDANIPVTFRFYSAWELTDENFAEKDYFLNMITAEAERMNNPVIVKR